MSHTRVVCTVSRQGCLQRRAGLPSPQRPTGGGQLALQEEVPRDAPHWETGGAFPWGGEEKEPAGVESGGGEAPRGSGLGPCANSPLSTRQEAGAGRAVFPAVPLCPSFTTPGFLRLLPTTPCALFLACPRSAASALWT